MGVTNNEFLERSFIRSELSPISLRSTRRPDDSRTASRRAPTCRAARYETSVPRKELMCLRWAKLSHSSTAISVRQSTILTETRRSFSSNSAAREILRHWGRGVRQESSALAIKPNTVLLRFDVYRRADRGYDCMTVCAERSQRKSWSLGAESIKIQSSC